MKRLLFFLIIFFSLVSFVKASTNVSSFEELKTAIENGESDIKIIANFKFNDVITINSNVVIDGNIKMITRENGYTGSFISITSDGSLEMKDIIIEGGAPGWYMDYENRAYVNGDESSYVMVPTISSDDDIISDASLITNEGNLTLNNVVIENNRSTVSGSILSGIGNSTINDSTFKHSCSLVDDGGFFFRKGTTKINNSTFKDLVAGCGITDYKANVGNSGAIGANTSGYLEIIDSLFEDNFAQWNGGAVTTYNQNTVIKGTIFRHNMVGNDGSALQLISQNRSFSMEDTLFEKNIGFATNGQSLGTILCSYSVNTEDTPLLFKNIIFRENEAAAGGMIADRVYSPYLVFENIEVYNNKVHSGGAVYAQKANYSFKNLNCHDNVASRNGGCICSYSNTSKIEIDNSTISDNKAQRGGGITIYSKELAVNNSSIINNYSDEYGGGIFVYGTSQGYNSIVNIQNSIIKDNETGKYGGGVCIMDRENVFSKFTMDDVSKIYDNYAGISADDFMYERNGDSNADNLISLNDISKVGINGIDGWYNDNKDDRFVDTENLTKYENFASINGNNVYLKAAGINDIDYNLNGGENTKILGVTMRYGTTITITDEVPVFEGNKFDGWNTKIDGSGKWLRAGDTYDGSDGYIIYAIYSSIEKEKDDVINPETKDRIILILILSIILLLFIIALKVLKNNTKQWS